MIKKIAVKSPKILMITNFVTMKLCADGLCALGAVPVMSAFEEETEEIAAVSDAVVINLGTPDAARYEAMLLAGQFACRQEIPVLFDAVGLQLSNIRLEMTRGLLDDISFAVIKGNAKEMAALYALLGNEPCENERELAKKLALETESVIVITGAKDVISDGEKTAVLANGCPEMAQISGTGCLLGAVIGAFLGSNLAPFEAALMGTALVGICGERACANSKAKGEGIGSMAVYLLDELYNATEACLEEIICEYQG